MAETPFFFDRANARLFAVLHEPSGPERIPVVFCHAFAEEKLWSHRVFVSFARELARRGHPVLRFDYFGNGDSSGAFSQSSVATALDDIEAAVEELKRRTGASRVGLLGLRLGASLAFKVASQRSDVESLVMWSPVLDGGRYLQELLRINVTTQLAVYREVRQDREALAAVLEGDGTVNVDGYEMRRDMANQLVSLSLADERSTSTARTLIVLIERSPAVKPTRDLEAFSARLRDVEVQIVQEDPFWKEILRFYYTAPNLFAATLHWLGHESLSEPSTRRVIH